MSRKSKWIKLFGASLCAVLLLSTAGCGKQAADGGDDTVYKYTVSHYIEGDTALPSGETEFSKLLKEKFNIELDYELVPRTNWEEKVNLLFASGDEPDVVTGGKEPLYKKWGSKGYIQPIDVTGMDNYLSYWTEDEWKKIRSLATTNDDKLFYLPSVTSNKAGGNWAYRKDLFDEVGVTEFPKTTEELKTALVKIHEKHPDKIIYNDKTSHYQWFWIPELALNESSYVDPVTNEYVPYAFVTDRARDMFGFFHELYQEGLIDREIMSSTGQRTQEKIASGSIIMTFGDPGMTESYNTLTRKAEPQANWVSTPQMITAYPDRGTIFKHTAYYANWGPAFTYKVEGDRLDRIKKYFDWCATDEGMKVFTFGFEGVTYDTVDGKATLHSDIYDKRTNPNGYRLIKWGVPSTVTSKFKAHPDSVDPKTQAAFDATGEFQFNEPNYYFFDYFAMNYSEEDDAARTDLETAVKEVKDRYEAMFIMGEKDPREDAIWQEYLSAMDNAGLQELSDIKSRTYEASNHI